MAVRAIQLDPGDDVASVLGAVVPGGEVQVESAAGDAPGQRLVSSGAIPFGHKIAVHDVRAGSLVKKYGHPIGRARAAISTGGHVHVHNISGLSELAGGETTGTAGGGTAGAGVGEQSVSVTPRRPMQDEPLQYAAADLKEFVATLTTRSGVLPEAAGDVAEGLVEADLRGVTTHGLRRLVPYLNRVRSGAVDGTARPVAHSTGAVVVVDGNNAMGHHVARTAVDAVVPLAAQHGVAAAGVRGSNHFGFAGLSATQIASHGMVGLAISNGTPCVAPPGGTTPFFSNNPLAIAAPLDGDRYFELDLATSATSRDHVRQAAADGRSIPVGWALDAEGRPTTVAAAAWVGSMLPIGGFRGFALIAALEVLAGVLTGAATADEVPAKDRAAEPERLGHFLLALAPGAFDSSEEAFRRRMVALAERLRQAPTAGRQDRPRLPGERRWRLRTERLAHGVPVDRATMEGLRELAARLGVDPPEPVTGDAR